jgi:fructose-1,6-bisphosphatase I
MKIRDIFSMSQVVILPNDTVSQAPNLQDWLKTWTQAGADRADLARIITAIAEATGPLADRLALGAIDGDPTAIVGTNDSGDSQKALDVVAHDHFIAALKPTSVREILSEEAEAIVAVNRDGKFNIAMDPIDGSGSIGIGAQLGMFFCIFPSDGGFLRSGRDIVAAGYISFGHSMDFALSLGEGLMMATYDRRVDAFRVTDVNMRMPEKASVLAYNASNTGNWSPSLQRYIADCLAGKSGQRGRSFNMRWLAAAVGDLHRILRQGGVFLYPGDSREGFAKGRLRLTYEAFPMAYLVEQAGGAATDGTMAILDRVPESLHEHTPLIFGSASEIATIHDYVSH